MLMTNSYSLSTHLPDGPNDKETRKTHKKNSIQVVQNIIKNSSSRFLSSCSSIFLPALPSLPKTFLEGFSRYQLSKISITWTSRRKNRFFPSSKTHFNIVKTKFIVECNVSRWLSLLFPESGSFSADKEGEDEGNKQRRTSSLFNLILSSFTSSSSLRLKGRNHFLEWVARVESVIFLSIPIPFSLIFIAQSSFIRLINCSTMRWSQFCCPHLRLSPSQPAFLHHQFIGIIS